ncbi:uncharacterized protein LOC124496228 [Dermatophagoides farinae]|uniref:uncharacterized protein LOC124496228 n=1 Tax=Dermatophagoides farinae TaxID=6954 RepID=UPI003F5FCD4F
MSYIIWTYIVLNTTQLISQQSIHWNMNKLFVQVVLLIPLVVTTTNAAASTTPVIIDTDCGQYSDDVTAMAIMHSYADQNRAHILAIVANDRYEGIVPVIEAINRYFNRTDIQIGVTKDQNAYDSGRNLTWPDFVIQNYPHPMYGRNDQAENAVSLYRRMLATSADNSVVILSIGFFTNLAHLLDSESDEYSPLSGRQLIQTKVNRMIAMAGNFPNGSEWNIEKQVQASQHVINLWPTSVIFTGAEVGQHLQCGQNIINDTRLANSPIREAWIIQKEQNIPDACFDEVAAFISINGVEPFYKLAYGTMQISSDGKNIWHQSPDNKPTRLAYVKQVASDQQILNVMDPLLQR